MNLNDSVATLKGVGPKKQLALNTLGIQTLNDLLNYFPFRYDDLTVQALTELPPQVVVTIKGTVLNPPQFFKFGNHRTRVTFLMRVATVTIRVTFFNQPWIQKQVQPNQPLLVYGRLDQSHSVMNGIKLIDPRQPKLAAVYSVNRQVSQGGLQKLIRAAYDQYHQVIPEIIPQSLRQKYHLETHQQVVHDMHFPQTGPAAKRALRTAKFEEFFIFQMQLQLLQMRRGDLAGTVIQADPHALAQLTDQLPFQLTRAQRRAIDEILVDLGSPRQMNRLLQGDVGSGKTIVAAVAIYATVLAGAQAVLMVPTELLAEQHADRLAQLFAPFSVSIALLTGTTKAAVRKSILPRIQNGSIDIVIGTHAVIQDAVQFHHLGLAVIDEQHRFGVHQRGALRQKGQAPNVLTMTATPIPRTMMMTTYGEMTVSIINELPAGRKPVITKWVKWQQLAAILPIIQQRLAQHAQMYVVAPLIETSDHSTLQSTTTIMELLRNAFPEVKIGLLHGQMKDADKNAIMHSFQDQSIQILVTTTVIEVGVDVATASLMLIFNADHFGLAQLHQLRGRVGRGSTQAYCFLVADPKTELGRQRLAVMVNTNDGFIVAQKDLELRGPGDLMGAQQSGVRHFKIGDPVADVVMLSYAQAEAQLIVQDPQWTLKTENLLLVKYLNTESFGDSLD